MLTFYKIDAKHAHHRSPPQYINTSQYIQQRPNTIYRIGCQLLRIANTNIYRDTSVLIPVLKYLCCYALPVLLTNANISRLPFQLWSLADLVLNIVTNIIIIIISLRDRHHSSFGLSPI